MEVLANVYYQANSVQRRDAKDLMTSYANLIHWRDDGEDSVLDIGCGPGDVTLDFIAPNLPKRFNKLVGVDLSEDMVKHANESSPDPRIRFETWNMVGDAELLLENHPEGFDHVFSFYTLHWHPDQRKIFQNIYDLLTPGGDCFLAFLGRHDIYDVTLRLSEMPKWCKITNNMNQLTIPFQYKNNRASIVRELLRAIGFRYYFVEVSDKKFVYRNLNEIERNITAVNPFMGKMNSAQKQEYFNDYIDTICELGMGGPKENGSDYQFNSEYQLMIVYARK